MNDRHERLDFPPSRTLGITVIGDYIVSEGAERVLDRLQRLGIGAVACSPTVAAPSAEGEGTFAPPDDAGSSPRRFERPLFGREALWLSSAPSYVPDTRCYEGCAYRPAAATALTQAHGEEISRFINGALARGWEVYLQVPAARPPGLRDEDRPRLPDGRIAPSRLADTASLASPAVRAHVRAWVRDLLQHYPEVTGIRIDWPEYPCYTIGEAFQDFGPHVADWARWRGFDFDAAHRAARRWYRQLHETLTNRDLQHCLERRAGGENSLSPLAGLVAPGDALVDWLQIKSALCADFVAHWRASIGEWDATRRLVVQSFMPPFATLTGCDASLVAAHCDVIAPKLYTMHWSQMVKFWADHLLACHPDLDETLLVRVLVCLMDIADTDDIDARITDYGYPEPHEAHPVSSASQRRKVDTVLHQAGIGGAAKVGPMVHAYGPPDDVVRRFGVAADSACPIVWITRYGYLGDEKLLRIAARWRAGRVAE